MLIFQIHKKLPVLSTSQLQLVARAIEDGSESTEGLSEPELYDFIIDYTRSERLKTMEDEGMAQLLSLQELLQELTSIDSGSGEANVPAVPIDNALTHTHRQVSASAEDIHTYAMDKHKHAQPSHTDFHAPPSLSHDSPALTSPIDRTIYTPGHLGDTGTRDTQQGRASLSSSVTDQVVRLSDVTALLPRRECKFHGGQISDTGSDISFSGLCKQIDTALQEGFSEVEIIRAVLKITKSGTFREMLTNHDGLTVNGLKRLLRAHVRDKGVTELFHELSNAKQHDKESPHQFLYRLIGLKQQVLFESQQPGVEFNYDKRLVQGTFLHSLYQGLNDRNSYVRQDIKPFLADTQVSDDSLLEQLTKSTMEEEARLKRLGAVAKSRSVTVSVAHSDITVPTDVTKQNQIDAELQANREAIRELTAQVSSLTQHMKLVNQPVDCPPTGSSSTPVKHPPSQTSEKKGRCPDCIMKEIINCPHCFVCGQAGHRAIGCLQRRMSVNGKRSLEKGSQRP